jgi:uncharacterized protein (DUF1697 family)
MPRYAAFLRGVNLGRNRRITNERLRGALEDLGYADVATFRASGNVVFDPGAGEDAKAIRDRVEAGLAESLGFEVVVFLRSAGQVKAIAARRPFPEDAPERPAGKAQVALLRGRPGRRAREAALELATEEDPLAIEGSELHWLPSCRMSESELDLKALESLLGPWTMRTMGTIEQIAVRYL